jgi:hypothetical protein
MARQKKKNIENARSHVEGMISAAAAGEDAQRVKARQDQHIEHDNLL